MIISEMHLAVKQKLDKTSSLELPSFEPEEIDFWLNDAIDTFIKERIEGLDVTRKGVEENQRRIDDLRTLVWIKDGLSTLTVDNETEYYNPDHTIHSFLLPTENSGEFDNIYFRYLNCNVRVSSVFEEAGFYLVAGTRFNIKRVTADTLEVEIRNPYSPYKMYNKKATPLMYIQGDEIKFVTDRNYTIDTVKLTYIKQPAVVDINTSTNCDLPPKVHSEIVNIAVQKMLENIESGRYQSFSVESTPLN
jgi:hypothetical protein